MVTDNKFIPGGDDTQIWYKNDVTGALSQNAPPPGQPAFAPGRDGQPVMVTDAAGKVTPEWQQQLSANQARNANPFGPGVGGIIGGLAAGSAFLPAAAGALGGAAGAAGGFGAAPGTLEAANAVGAGGGDALGSLIAGNTANWGLDAATAGAVGGAAGGLAAQAAPGAASDAGLPTAANASAQGLPSALPEVTAPGAALPETAPTPPAASPEPAAPGPPSGTAPTAPTAPTPTGGPGLPSLGQAATAASGAAAAKTLLGGSGVTDEQLLTGQAPEAGGNQAGDVSTGFSGQGAGPDGSGVPTGLPSADTSTSGLPGLPSNASDLLKLAPAIGGLAGLATSSSNANKYFDEIKSLGGPQRDIANQLLAQYKAGTINAADAFNIQQTKQAAINKANDFYAKAGIPDSSQLQGTIANINQQADAQTEQARQNLLTQGLNELNVTDQTQVEAIKAQIAGDQAAAAALTSFMQMLGTLGAKLPATQSGVATTK
jgi:hypothetical protein